MIIGYKTDKEVLFATDSCRYFGDTLFADGDGDNASIVKLPNNVLVGATSQKIKHLLMINSDWFLKCPRGRLTKNFLEKKIIPDLFFELLDQDLINEKSIKNGCPKFDGMILFAQDRKLFIVDSDFSVLAIKKYAVIGNESNMAAARLYVNQNPVSYEKLLYYAMRDAEENSKFVRSPFKLYSTKSDGYIELKGE